MSAPKTGGADPRLIAILSERHFSSLAWPRCLRSRAVEFAVLAPVVFCLGFAIAARM